MLSGGGVEQENTIHTHREAADASERDVRGKESDSSNLETEKSRLESDIESLCWKLIPLDERCLLSGLKREELELDEKIKRAEVRLKELNGELLSMP